MSPLLTLNKVTTGYGDLRVVWDVSLQVSAGEVYAILGRNGAGKTTVLRAMSGLNPLSGGSIELDGQDISKMAPYDRVKRGLGYVQENKRIMPEMTVEENLRLGAFSTRLTAAQMRERLDYAYSIFPILGDRNRHLAGFLSGGQQQMLAIAQAIMPRPRLLLVDEPSAGLAPAIVGTVLETLISLRDEGFTIVLVEQSVDFALAIASHLTVLDLGHSVHTSAADHPGITQIIEDAYLGRLEPETAR